MNYMDVIVDALSNTSNISSSHPVEEDNHAIQICGIVFYSILFVCTLALYIYKRLKYALTVRQLATLFYIGLPVFMLVRTTWFILETKEGDGVSIASNLINRISLCVFLFVFNALLFYWIDTVHTTVNVAFAKEAFQGSLDYEFISPRGRFLFWLFTLIVIALTLVLAVVRAALIGTADKSASDYADMKKTINDLYDANNIIIALTFLAYGICFFIYGTTLNCRIKKNNSSSTADLIKAEIFSIVLMCCFIFRCIMFSYRVLTGKYLDNNVYITFSYFVPEIIPTVMCLWSTNTKMFNEADRSRNSASEA